MNILIISLLFIAFILAIVMYCVILVSNEYPHETLLSLQIITYSFIFIALLGCCVFGLPQLNN